MKRYESIDTLQKVLSKGVFSYAADPKKAAGRALGTFVELISFYLLKSWGLERFVAIERGLSEFANPLVAHNVEFTLHRSCKLTDVVLPLEGQAFTSRKLVERIQTGMIHGNVRRTNNSLITSNGLVKNACTVAEYEEGFVNAYLERGNVRGKINVALYNLPVHPFAMIECKRVGVEEGQKKGPQTIEKAKQGAYVARTVSSLQRIRLKNGNIAGFVERGNGTYLCDDYYRLLGRIVAGDEPELIDDFILTIGIVSNHGNWFTSENRNKELEVLAQSYDWLLFLTDEGLASFINEVVVAEDDALPWSRRAFFESYKSDKKGNRFTKSRIDLNADRELTGYFKKNTKKISKWFNLISPSNVSMDILKKQLLQLATERRNTI